MSHEQLSKLSGINESKIIDIENGTDLPSISTLEAIAGGLGKNLVIDFV